jgi:hypothetical protein
VVVGGIVVVVVGGIVVVVVVVAVVVVVVGIVVVVVVVAVVVGGGTRAPTVTTQVSVRRELLDVMTTRTVRRSMTKLSFANARPSCSKSRPPQRYVPLNTIPTPADSSHRLPSGTLCSSTTKGPPVLTKWRVVESAVRTRGASTRRLVTGPLNGRRVDGLGGSMNRVTGRGRAVRGL